MAKRLYRNESEKIIGGVCAGLGDFLGIDPVFIRIFFIMWTIFGELSVLAYFLLWVIVPRNTDPDADEKFEVNELGSRVHQMGREIQEITRSPSNELIIFTGVGLITWGAYYILRRVVPFADYIPYTQYLWPALLIVAGGYVIFRATRREK